MGARIILVVLVVLVLTLFGCANGGDTPDLGTAPAATGSEAPGSGEAPPSSGETSAMLAPPGLYDQPDGSVQAFGTLAYRDLEGGFWAVVDTVIPEEADAAAVVAVIVPDDDIAGSLESYRGEIVSIIGDLQDMSIYQAGPVIEGRSVEVVTDMVVN